MTASETAKALGCKSLAQVSEISQVPIRTLQDWSKSKPVLFKLVCVGVVSEIREDKQ